MRALTVSLAILAATIVGGAAWQIAHRASAPESTTSVEIQVKPVAPPAPVPAPVGQMDVGLGMDDIHPQPVIARAPPAPIVVRKVVDKPEPSEQDGYEWAADQGVYTHRECPAAPVDFSVGCHHYVQHIQDGPNG